MKSGYESITWLMDKEGREFVCYLDAMKTASGESVALTDEIKKRCFNVNEIIGTERW